MTEKANADILVVGMGPSGSSCAQLLAVMGLNVVGIDRKEFPRDKACGGCITDRIWRLLDGVIEEAIEREYRGARLVPSIGDELCFRSENPIAYGVSREIFDDLLLSKAREAGVRVRLGEAFLRAYERNGYVEAVTSRGTYRVRYIVGADGAAGILSKKLRGRGPSMVAYEARVHGWPFDDPQDTVRIYFGAVPGGYAWAFPKEGYTSAGTVTRWPKKNDPLVLLKRFLSETFDIDEREPVIVRGGIIPLYRKGYRSRIAGNRILLVGDSAGVVDPFLAEGISYAVLSSFLAAPIVASAAAQGDGDLSLYETAVEKVIHLSFDTSSTFSRYIYRFPRLALHAIRKKQDTIEELFELIRGNTDYREFTGGLRAIIRILR